MPAKRPFSRKPQKKKKRQNFTLASELHNEDNNINININIININNINNNNNNNNLSRVEFISQTWLRTPASKVNYSRVTR